MATSAFWFRRDLRLKDNTGLNAALRNGHKILLVFIFDTNFTDELPTNDPRINFIYDRLNQLNIDLSELNAGILLEKGNPLNIWEKLIKEYQLNAIYTNHDYEPYSIGRDNDIEKLCQSYNTDFKSFKDQVIFEKDEVSKDNSQAYTVFTPYKNKWLATLKESHTFISDPDLHFTKCIKPTSPFPSKSSLQIKPNNIQIKQYNLSNLSNYEQLRNLPWEDGGTYLGPHLRFGTVSIREIITVAIQHSHVFLNELIWREFFMQILYHFPYVVQQSFRSKYENIPWHNDQTNFEKWCNGETGYPMVDAGMRELNKSGYMHNRVRMITASFLVKHLLIDWRWGEAYFAKKLLDYELSSNNGNWQWAAGTGCDAAPYFRVFNPTIQQEKFDPGMKYIKKWIPEFGTSTYPAPMIDHAVARKRAIKTYKIAISQS